MNQEPAIKSSRSVTPLKEAGPQPAPPPRVEPAVRPINWSDFRDHLSTADQQGHRMWIYPRKPAGAYYRARTWLSWFLLAVMFSGPFIRVHGNPLLLINIVERKFVILGQIFWPQDMVISAITLLIFFTGIIVFTAAFGRLWCGWVCPQTVLMEMVFRKIEYFIEGDAGAQRALNRAPWTRSKLIRKATKHAIFFALSFIVGNTLLAYLIGTEQLYKIITDNPLHHVQGLGFMLAFTLLFYSIFARFREQACTFICPYGRFQSTLLDENTIVVAYDYKRGEKRGPLRRARTAEQQRDSGVGDCVDCRQCVSVCPTGIDIRNGIQMECVHCTACIDACDAVMRRINRPVELIRYASQNGIERGQKLRFTPRLAGYSAVLIALIGVWFVLVFSRSDVETTLLRAPGALFQQMPDGRLSNLYTVKVINKTSRPVPVSLRLASPEGSLQVMGGSRDILVAPEKLAQTSVLIELSRDQLAHGQAKLEIGVYSGARKIQQLKTAFLGPRDDSTRESEPK